MESFCKNARYVGAHSVRPRSRALIGRAHTVRPYTMLPVVRNRLPPPGGGILRLIL